ncbi:hypothetical protein D3C83_121080 [compost metagenome]
MDHAAFRGPVVFTAKPDLASDRERHALRAVKIMHDAQHVPVLKFNSELLKMSQVLDVRQESGNPRRRFDPDIGLTRLVRSLDQVAVIGGG